MNLKQLLKNNKYFMQCYNMVFYGYYSGLTLISPVLNTKKRYKSAFHKNLNLSNPITFNEKILWLKLNRYMRDPLVIQCADKYAVRAYVKQVGCSEILNELIGVYNTPSEINWNDFPEKFALKWNFGCGLNIICENKEALDIPATMRQLEKWRKDKCWLPYSELQYRYAPKKIICEKYLKNGSGRLPEDYKIYCFNGVPQYVMVCVGREHGHPKFYFFDRDWKLARINHDSMHAAPDFILEKPACMELMFDYAAKLSKPFSFVRADFYAVDGQAVFGELTFTPCGGLDNVMPESMDVLFGNMLDIGIP